MLEPNNHNDGGTMDTLSIQPSIIPMGKSAGKTTETILTVTYRNGEVAFRCATCDKTFASYRSAFGHRSKHRTGTRQTKTVPLRDALREVADQLTALADGKRPAAATADTDDKKVKSLETRLFRERARRKAAEKALADIRHALGFTEVKP
jgi:uncharacterized C2H2 Zn-finger protein